MQHAGPVQQALCVGRTSIASASAPVTGMRRRSAVQCATKDAPEITKILTKWYMPSPRKTAMAKNTWRRNKARVRLHRSACTVRQH